MTTKNVTTKMSAQKIFVYARLAIVRALKSKIAAHAKKIAMIRIAAPTISAILTTIVFITN
jgi:hypothetical protein